MSNSRIEIDYFATLSASEKPRLRDSLVASLPQSLQKKRASAHRNGIIVI